ncbi:MAG TPA: type II secretion system F family protein [Gemmatimonadales bacterium]|nr:type II secretion system F family protein [Gemmatimonadales bacterium]
MPTSSWLSAGMVFLAVALGTVAIALLLEFSRQRLRGRKMVGQLRRLAQEGPDEASDALIRRPGFQQKLFDPVLAHLPHAADIALLMQQGGLQWTLQTYAVVTLGLALSFGLAAALIFPWLAGLAAALFGASIPYMVIKRKAAKRMGQFEAQLPGAIDLIGRAIRAGHPLSAGLKMVADETTDPIAGEFRRVFEEQRFGLAFEDTLLSLADRVPLVDVRILNTAILIQREVGGNLAEVLDNMAQMIRQRFKLRRQLRVITAQGRISGYVLAVLPIVLGVVIFLLNPSYMSTLFQAGIGRILVAGAIVLQILGYFWIRKIVDIDF